MQVHSFYCLAAKKLSTRDVLENSAAKQGGGKEKPDGHLGVVEIKIGFNTWSGAWGARSLYRSRFNFPAGNLPENATGGRVWGGSRTRAAFPRHVTQYTQQHSHSWRQVARTLRCWLQGRRASARAEHQAMVTTGVKNQSAWDRMRGSTGVGTGALAGAECILCLWVGSIGRVGTVKLVTDHRALTENSF